MKKLLIAIIISIMMISSTGCENLIGSHEDIENLELMNVIGVDKQKNIVKLIGVSQAAKSPGGGRGAPEIEPVIQISEGDTIFNATRLMHTYSTKKPFWGLAEQIIIGEDAARTSLPEIIDFFTRDHELRLNMDVFIVKGNSAEDIIKSSSSGKSFIGNTLKSLTKSVGDASMSTEVKLYELANMLDSKTSCPYLPCLQIVDGLKQSGSEPNASLKLMGLAVFKDDKLLYYLDGNETRGFNFIIGKVKSGPIVVKDPTGQEVSLEIITSNAKIKTYINDEIPSADINIKVSSNITEQRSAQNLILEEPLNFLKSQQDNVIKSEVSNVIKLAQERNTDIFGFGDTIFHQHPGEWKKIEDKWEETFPDMKINVNVESKINRTYNIEQPSRYKKKGKKE